MPSGFAALGLFVAFEASGYLWVEIERCDAWDIGWMRRAYHHQLPIGERDNEPPAVLCLDWCYALRLSAICSPVPLSPRFRSLRSVLRSSPTVSSGQASRRKRALASGCAVGHYFCVVKRVRSWALLLRS